MLPSRAVASIARRWRMYPIFRSGVHRAVFRSVTTTSEHREVKHIDTMPGPGLLQSMVMMMKHGGLKNFSDIQREKFEKFGPIFKEKMFGKQVVHIADAEANAVIARTEGAFPTREFTHVDVIEDTAVYSFGGNDYERWKAVRSPVAPSFLRPVEVQKFTPGMDSVAKDAVGRLRRVMKDGRVIPLYRELSGFTTENVLLAVYGVRMGFYRHPQNPKVIEFMETISDFNMALMSLSMAHPLLRNVRTPMYKKLARAKEKLYTLAGEFADFRTREQKNGFVCPVHLFEALPHKSDEGNSEDANHLAIGLSQGGVDTTAVTLAWCLYHLAWNPDVQEKAYEEVVSVMGTNTDDKSSENPQFHSKLTYINACVKEAMRLTPIAPMIPRTLEKDTTVCGYTIPAGTSLYLWYSFLSSSSEHFNKPDEFNPRRWIRGDPQEEIRPFASLPFGFGVRMCLARRFAQLEITIYLARVLQTFRLEYVEDDPIKATMHKTMMSPDRELPIRIVEIS